MINVTTHDISLVKQPVQRRYVKLSVLNREWRSVGVISGRLISGNIDVDGTSDVRRSASLTMETDIVNMVLISGFMMNYYVKLYCGIEDNNTSEVNWYGMGVFVVAQSGYSYDPVTRRLSITLSDLMCDLAGDRAGTLHAYTTIVKQGERIDNTIKAVLSLCGFDNYDICPIGVLRETSTFFDSEASEEDFLIPYDLEFQSGVTGYEIIEKCVSLYPYYEAGFDVDGVFFVRRNALEDNDDFVILSADMLRELVISEDTSIDWSAVKNYVEVWGKDGLYYGEAFDKNPDSPFQVAATRPLRLVVKDNSDGINTNNIYDRYKDTELAKELLTQQAEKEELIAQLEAVENPTQAERQQLAQAKTELANIKQRQAQNVAIKGDDLARQWAEKILYEKARLNDSISLKTILLPFINDAGFKISYRSKTDNIVKTYLVTGVSHDLSSNTTSLTAVRFYSDQVSALQDALGKVTINSYSVDGMTVTVTFSAVDFAQSYGLLIDRKVVVKGTGTTLSYTLPDEYEGTHYIEVQAYAEGYRNGAYSDTITAEFVSGDYLITEDGDFIVTENDETINISEPEG